MSPQAFHYFAPAYLIYALDREADYPDTPSAFLNQLAPPSGIPFYDAEEYNALLKRFSVPQKRAIACVIDYRIQEMNCFDGVGPGHYWHKWIE